MSRRLGEKKDDIFSDEPRTFGERERLIWQNAGGDVVFRLGEQKSPAEFAVFAGGWYDWLACNLWLWTVLVGCRGEVSQFLLAEACWRRTGVKALQAWIRFVKSFSLASIRTSFTLRSRSCFFRFSREQGTPVKCLLASREGSFAMRSIINTIAIVTRNVVAAANRQAVSAVAGMGTLRVADTHPSRHLYAGSAGIKRSKSGYERPAWFAWLPSQLFRELCPSVDTSSQRPGQSSRSRRPQGFRSLLLRG